MIRHDEHRLLSEIQATEFHRGGSHGPRLASSHDMRQQRAASLEDAPDCVLLMWCEISIAEGGAHHPRQRQMRAVKIAEPDVVEPEVVLLRQPRRALAIFPNPIAKA